MVSDLNFGNVALLLRLLNVVVIYNNNNKNDNNNNNNNINTNSRVNIEMRRKFQSNQLATSREIILINSGSYFYTN